MKTVPQNLTQRRLPFMIKNHSLLTSVFLSGALLLTGCQTTNVNPSNTLAANPSPSTAKKTLASALQKQRRQSFRYHSNIEISHRQQRTAASGTQVVASDYVDAHCEETHDQAYADLIVQAEKQNKDIFATDYDKERDALKQSYLECVDAYYAWEEHQYDSDVTVPADYQALFDNYEDKPKTLDIKKAQLLDEYLLKPLSIDAQGVYQPLAGKATMLASAQYLARNHHSSINQPIYVDMKNGDIYLWADNIAMINSELLDDKLGTKWRNKWLKIAIDDGTLPKGFGREVIKAHFAALDLTYDGAPVSQFDYVASNTLAALSPKLPAHQLSAMLPSAQIIRRVQSFESYQEDYQHYIQTFYNRISQQYPELVKDAEPTPDFETLPSSKEMTSKAVVQKILAFIKTQMDEDASAQNDAAKNTAVQELYGFDKRGQLKWQHIHRQLDSTSKSDTDNSMMIDVLQQYSAINSKDLAFPNLPREVQTPNASNSIDLREYAPELLEYYRDGNGTAVGKMIFSALPMAKERFGTIE